MSPTLSTVLSDPDYLPHALDAGRETLTFLPTTAERLRRPSFIDGRSDLATGPSIGLPLDAVLAADMVRPAGPDRMIFHTSFCGSTLLARMLDVPGAAFVLKEPNLLVDLAGWKKAAGAPGEPRLAAALDWARAALRRRWRADERILIKPSNWANNLVGDLIADPAAIRPLFVTMERRPFLLAVLRGGRDRLAFTAQVAAHLAGQGAGGALLRQAIGATDDPIGRAVHLAVLTLHLQMEIFAEAMRRGGWDGGSVIDAATLFTRPVDAALAANAILDLGINPAELAASAAVKARENAKLPGRSFIPALRESENDDVLRHHGARIDAALHWADRTLGTHPALEAAGDGTMTAAG